MNKLLITDVVVGESIQRSGPNQGSPTKWAVVTYEGLNGIATRITQSWRMAMAMKGQMVDGSIIKADVVPYTATIKKDNGEAVTDTFNKRNVVIFAGETLEQACKASGHTLSATPSNPTATVAGVSVDVMLAESGIPEAAFSHGDYAQTGNRRVTGQNEFNQQSANANQHDTLTPRGGAAGQRGNDAQLDD